MKQVQVGNIVYWKQQRAMRRARVIFAPAQPSAWVLVTGFQYKNGTLARPQRLRTALILGLARDPGRTIWEIPVILNRDLNAKKQSRPRRLTRRS